MERYAYNNKLQNVFSWLRLFWCLVTQELMSAANKLLVTRSLLLEYHGATVPDYTILFSGTDSGALRWQGSHSAEVYKT